MRRVLRLVRAVLLGVLTLLALATAATWTYGAWTGNWRGIAGRWGGAKGERFSFCAAVDQGEAFSLSCEDDEGPAVDQGWYWNSWDRGWRWKYTWDSPTLERLAAVLPDCYIEAWNSGPGARPMHYGGRGFFLILEPWFALALFSFWPFLALVRYGIRRYRRRWRRLRGRCMRCGYSLTGLPGPQCPECGTPLPTSTENVSRVGSTVRTGASDRA